VSQPIVNWRLWYSDGSSVASWESSWEDAPTDDIQLLILHHDAEHCTIIMGEDEYYLPGETAVKYGKWMDTGAYDALVEWVLQLESQRDE
jgi:hypothetical protein